MPTPSLASPRPRPAALLLTASLVLASAWPDDAVRAQGLPKALPAGHTGQAGQIEQAAPAKPAGAVGAARPAWETACPLRVTEVQPDPHLTARFAGLHGWTGADGAHSVRLDARRVLWWFGDTFVGDVRGQRRDASTAMINNSGALQHLSSADSAQTTASDALHFFWRASRQGPGAWITPGLACDPRQKREHALAPLQAGKPTPEATNQPEAPRSDRAEAASWYWPGDLFCDTQGLVLFAMRVASIRVTPQTPEGFNFRELDNHLLYVRNPHEDPLKWRFERHTLPSQPRLGAACLGDSHWLYAYGLLPADPTRGLDRPLGLARLPRPQIRRSKASDWEVWTTAGRWKQLGKSDLRETKGSANEVAVLFRDAAPEMSVARVPGLSGLVAVYTPLGLADTICARWAPRPEGPWSAPCTLYTCPEASQGLLTYAARAHPEQSRTSGELVLTYCCNTPHNAEHMRDARIYRPRALRVHLAVSGLQGCDQPAAQGAKVQAKAAWPARGASSRAR